ncbi:MAG: NAD(P)/FAD-dependent oxidoreductase [Chloroflexi bacterium]|nr:NAD(P)/FAD-dependent oxidoreductase [Chloroflexota bacterium]
MTFASTDGARFVIIGNGVAGTTAAEHIRKNDPQADVTLIAGESYPLYNRVALPIFLKGRVAEKNVMMRTREIHQQRGVRLLLDTWVDTINLEERLVCTADGKELPFDRLLIATGGTPRPLEVPGAHLHGVYAFQTLDDTKALIARCEESRFAVALGGSYIGYELAEAFSHRGLHTTWIMRGDRFLRRLLDHEGGEVVNLLARDRGVEVVYNDWVCGISSDNGVPKSVSTAGGREFPADMVGYGIGLRYYTELAESIGLEVNKAILTDECLRTSAPDVYAAGDIAEFFDVIISRHNQMGTWDNAASHGRLVAQNMLGKDLVYTEVPTYVTTMFGSRLSVLGLTPESHPELEREVQSNRETRKYRALFLYEGRLVGAVIIGVLKGRRKLEELIKGRQPIVGDRRALFDLLGPIDEHEPREL